MKRFIPILVIIMMSLFLTACGDGDQTQNGTNDQNTTDDAHENHDKGADNGKDGFSKEFNQTIVDNENVKATLVKVEKVIDDFFDEEKVEITFEVQNKKDTTIEVQAREVSADNKMIDETMLTMSQEVAPGKLADAVLTIQNYEGDLPKMEEVIEMNLHIFSWEDYDYSEDHKVTINLKGE